MIRLALAAALLAAAPQDAERLNVLMICVDDLRPQLGCYGDSTVKSPHVDRLAARGTLFERAYCQQALCSPSRISLLTGLYPPTTGIFEIGPTLRSKKPDVVTLPQHFKNHGYLARSLGKVYHGGIDDPESWSVPSWRSDAPRYGPDGTAAVRRRRSEMKQKGEAEPAKGPGKSFYAGPAFEAPEVHDDALTDGDTAREGVAALQALAKTPDRPFFLAVGFANPHVPWVAPKRYFDLYRPEALPLASFSEPPKDAPDYAARTGADFTWYGNVPKDYRTNEAFQRDCLRGYLAAISYVDAQVGRLLDALEETGLAKRTLVVFWGDHGYYMGEHGWWGGKHNNYEGATRAPLIIARPGATAARTRSLAEFVDLAPTLVDLCGLPKHPGFEGRSLRPVLDDPTASVREAARSWYPKGGRLGAAIRTDRHRYVEWAPKNGGTPDRELYDYEADPLERENLAGRPQHADLVEALSKRLAR